MGKIRLNSSPKNPFTKRNVKKDGPTYKKIDLICRHNVVGGNVVDLNKLCLKWLKDNHPNVKISKLKSPPKVPLKVRSPKRKKSPVSRFISPHLHIRVLRLSVSLCLGFSGIFSPGCKNTQSLLLHSSPYLHGLFFFYNLSFYSFSWDDSRLGDFVDNEASSNKEDNGSDVYLVFFCLTIVMIIYF